MTYGFLIPLAADLEVRDGEFSWNFEAAEAVVSEYSYSSPIDFHDPSQIAGTPFFDDDRFIIKFNNFWVIEAPAGYSLLFTHPANRSRPAFQHADRSWSIATRSTRTLSISPRDGMTLALMAYCKKGTPIAQCFPVKRENWAGRYDVFSSEDSTRQIESRKRDFGRRRRLSAAVPGVEALNLFGLEKSRRRAGLKPKSATRGLRQHAECIAVAFRIAAHRITETLVAFVKLSEAEAGSGLD